MFFSFNIKKKKKTKKNSLPTHPPPHNIHLAKRRLAEPTHKENFTIFSST